MIQEKENVERNVPEVNETRPPKTPQKSAVDQGGQDIIASENIYGKYDFVPGDKVIFYDDFSDTDVGEFPRKWTLKGPGGGGNTVEVVDYKGKRYLRSVPPASKEEGLAATTLFIRLTPNEDMPEKFTVEFDAVLAQTNGYHQRVLPCLCLTTNGWPGSHAGIDLYLGRTGEITKYHNLGG